MRPKHRPLQLRLICVTWWYDRGQYRVDAWIFEVEVLLKVKEAYHLILKARLDGAVVHQVVRFKPFVSQEL